MSRPIAEFVTTVLGLPEGPLEAFVEALTHRSFAQPKDYERLEFLGDAVLKLAISAWIFERFGALPEGAMTQIRAHLVADKTLAAIAEAMGIGHYLRLGPGELRTGGKTKQGNLASALEAVLAATYLRDGLAAAEGVVRRFWEAELASTSLAPGAENSKARLQELTQERYGSLPTYELEGCDGPPHDPTFHVTVKVQDRVCGRGSGTSKRRAEQEAATQALAELENPA